METLPEERIRGSSAHWSYLIAGGWRAITHEAGDSHGCNAFLVGNGNEGTGINSKYVYI